MQTTSQILMIRPVNFGFNAETAVNNAFQVAGNDSDVAKKAEQEFDTFVQVLRKEGVEVTVIDDTPEPHTPDSIFPNNWISFHDDGTVFLYPMFAANRRLERKPGIVKMIRESFIIKKVTDLSDYEEENLFLEGTGSLVLERENKIAYACLSPRTDIDMFKIWVSKSGYFPVSFHAADKSGNAIYHTNVMMCVADKFVVICLEAIISEAEKEKIINSINLTNKTIVEITLEQMNHFAGNMLQVNNTAGKKILVMSSQAYQALTPKQVKQLTQWNRIVHSPLNTIESNGGGSARCMMAEIHLPKK